LHHLINLLSDISYALVHSYQVAQESGFPSLHTLSSLLKPLNIPWCPMQSEGLQRQDLMYAAWSLGVVSLYAGLTEEDFGEGTTAEASGHRSGALGTALIHD
jgi:hypothetical protein